MARVDKVASMIKREIAVILREMDDRKIGMTSLTNVTISKDMSFARIYYSFLGTANERRTAADRLKNAARYIKGELGRRIEIRRIPDLLFVYDDSVERGVELVNKINKLASS